MAVLQHDLTQGDPRRHILLFALPLVQAMIFQAMYNAVDLFFAGRYLGLSGQAAVSVCGPVMNVFLRTVNGMSMGVSLLVGRRHGMGDMAYTRRGANTSITLYAMAAVAVTALGVGATPFLLRLIQTPAEALPMATTYLQIVFSGSIFTMGYSLINAFQRGFGDSRSSLYFVMVSTVVNIALDWFFLRFTDLQAAGLALATVAAQAVSFLLGVLYFRKNGHVVSFRLSSLTLHRGDAAELLRLGVPSAFQQLLVTAAHLTLSGIANSFGLAATAAYGIGLRIDAFAALPASAAGDSVAAFAAQNFGVGDEKRANEGRKGGAQLALLMGLAVAAVVLLFAPQLAGIFNQDPEVVALAASYLRWVTPLYLLVAYVYTYIGFVRGSGNTLFPVVQTLFIQYVVRIPLAMLLAYTLKLNLTGVALAWVVAPLGSFFIYAVYHHTGLWRRAWRRAQAKTAEK